MTYNLPGYVCGREEGRAVKTEVLNEFVVLVKCQSFTEAARELFISQPCLSEHISMLE
ncbi:MAG: LysR family transcriptional regulator, partial [Coriobacteriales bacterium]|nr:LysR family transcriptional regulator [Coriobacteriales bacterium]